MKTRIYNLIILDESGSMQSIKQAAINGMNETVQSIRDAQTKHEDQEHFITLVSFNSSEIKTIYNCVPVAEVKELTGKEYMPSSLTPLYDAMGQSLNVLRSKVTAEDKILVTIITDGEENSSREYDGPATKALVEELKEAGWVFAYIGANQDAVYVAETISVTNVMNFQATDHGTSSMLYKLKKSRDRMWNKISEGTFIACESNISFFNEDEEDDNE